MIWDELENFKPNHICTCSVKCFCSIEIVINQRKCEDRAMQFLRGLNYQYSNICYHVLQYLLYVPQFKLNLIFTSKLSLQLSRTLTFTYT